MVLMSLTGTTEKHIPASQAENIFFFSVSNPTLCSCTPKLIAFYALLKRVRCPVCREQYKFFIIFALIRGNGVRHQWFKGIWVGYWYKPTVPSVH